MVEGAYGMAKGLFTLMSGLGLIGGGTVLEAAGVGAIFGAAAQAISIPLVIAGTAEFSFAFAIAGQGYSNLYDNIKMASTDKLSDNVRQKQSFLDNEANKPAYIREKRTPLDKETVLNNKEYSKTSMKVKGASVYKNGDKYYYRDTLHKGERAHLEVFDKKGNHLGEANPLTGELIPNTADSKKKLKLK